MEVAALVTILTAVLIGPLLFRSIEHNVEIFFLNVGVATAIVTGRFDAALIRAAIGDPVSLALAVLVFGGVFRYARPLLERTFARIPLAMKPRWICFVLI